MMINIIFFSASLGAHKLLAKFLYEQTPIAQSGHLDRADSEIYIEIVKNRTFTSDMCNEGRYLHENTNKVNAGVIPVNTPFLLFISNENEEIIKDLIKIQTCYTGTL